jgi:hypothetical protein
MTARRHRARDETASEHITAVNERFVGEFTNGVGAKQASLHEKANAKLAKAAEVDV